MPTKRTYVLFMRPTLSLFFVCLCNIMSLFQAPPWLKRGDSGKKKERQEEDYGLDYEPFKSGSK